MLVFKEKKNFKRKYKSMKKAQVNWMVRIPSWLPVKIFKVGRALRFSVFLKYFLDVFFQSILEYINYGVKVKNII